MRIRSLMGWTLGLLVAFMATSGTGLALGYPVLSPAPVPEDPTIILTVLGGAGLAWQYFRSRLRK